MAEGRSREAWGHTSNVISWFCQCHAAKGKTFNPYEFNPFYAKRMAGGGRKVLGKEAVRKMMLDIGGTPVDQK